MRTSGDELSFKAFRNSDDPSEVVGLFEWESLDKAKQFLESKEIKQKMHEAGVAGKPDSHYLDEA